MAELKTQENDGDVLAFIARVENKRRREDSLVVLETMQRITAMPARMWGNSIVGFGAYEYTQKNGQVGRWPLTGFSPRKAALTVYIMPGFGNFGDLLARLGKFKHSVSCLYISRLDNVDMSVLESLIKISVDDMRRIYHA